VSNLLTVP